MIDIKHILKEHAYQNRPLAYDEAYGLGVYALQGCNGDPLAQIQSIAALCALHTKATYRWRGEAQSESDEKIPSSAAEQIAGICAAMLEKDIAVSPAGFLTPHVPYAMDNSGMGGDMIVTANVSTIAAFIAAAAGIPMAKHGSPANADGGRHGSSDFMRLLGVDTYATRQQVEQCLEETDFLYTEALDPQYKRIHRQTHEIAFLPHANDIIGPITNPLSPCLMTRRVLGVNHLIPPRIVAESYQILNERKITHMDHMLVVRGYGNDRSDTRGMDEASICRGGTQVAELQAGKISEYWLSPEDFGIEAVEVTLISPPKGMSKGDFSLKILKGEILGPPLQMVLANAALLFYLGGRSQDLKECYGMAEEVYANGKTYEKVLAVRERVPKD